MSHICPHCGYDLSPDEPINMGGMRFDPRGDVVWNGEHIHLQPAQRILVYSLLKERGRVLRRVVLAERMGYEGDDPGSLTETQICKLKRKYDFPIETVHGFGVRWAE